MNKNQPTLSEVRHREMGKRDPRIDTPIGDAYARYDSDDRVNGPDDFEAFADAIEVHSRVLLRDELERFFSFSLGGGAATVPITDDMIGDVEPGPFRIVTLFEGDEAHCLAYLQQEFREASDNAESDGCDEYWWLKAGLRRVIFEIESRAAVANAKGGDA